MSASIQSWSFTSSLVRTEISEQPRSWYALLTHARHEKIVVQRLRDYQVETFLPLLTQVRRWSDRKKVVEVPLFSCYVFAKLLPTPEGRLAALRTDGVYSLVGTAGKGTPIPDEQIDAVRRVVEERLPWQSHTFLKIGQRVRIRSGALDGVEGILASRSGESTLIVSIDAIQRSLAVRIDGYDVEPA
jgi:transcription antitermination factor NusG